MDGDGDLPFNGKTRTHQIAGEAMLVNRLQQARPKFPMHGEGRVHNGATDLVHFRGNRLPPVVAVVHSPCPL
ncbi:hypothetical protein GCM10010203_65030 [Actinomadura yumaensis]